MPREVQEPHLKPRSISWSKAGALTGEYLVIQEEVPANQRDMVTLLLGTLAGMASSVVAYWVGSSNGSMQKNAAMEKALARN